MTGKSAMRPIGPLRCCNGPLRSASGTLLSSVEPLRQGLQRAGCGQSEYRISIGRPARLPEGFTISRGALAFFVQDLRLKLGRWS